MASVITKYFRMNNAEKLLKSFEAQSSSYTYLYIGNVSDWNDEFNPPTPQNTVEQVSYLSWRDMIAAKRITSSDVSFAIPRNNWAFNTVYDEYSDTKDLTDSKYYLMNSTFDVYKCLSNNGGIPSTIEPTGTSTTNIVTLDGYIWKYMYTISAAESLKFVTPDFIPVKTLENNDGSLQWTVQQAASNGAIDIIKVANTGSGYVYQSNTVSFVANSTVLNLDVSASATDDYYNEASLFISAGLGSGQLREIADYNGTTKQVTLSSPLNVLPDTSSKYLVSPTINILGDGSDATAYARVNSSNGAINSIQVVSPGQNYSFSTLEIVDAAGSSGASANCTVVIPPIGGHGSDPVNELSGHNVILNAKFVGEEGGVFPANNDFRILGLLKDPLLANNEPASSSHYNQMTRLTISGATGSFVQDEVVEGSLSSATGKVVTFANTNVSGTEGVLSLSGVIGEFTTETITGQTSSTIASIDLITSPDLKVHSGRVLYIENRTATTRSPDQSEDIKLVIRY